MALLCRSLVCIISLFINRSRGNKHQTLAEMIEMQDDNVTASWSSCLPSNGALKPSFVHPLIIKPSIKFTVVQAVEIRDRWPQEIKLKVNFFWTTRRRPSHSISTEHSLLIRSSSENSPFFAEPVLSSFFQRRLASSPQSLFRRAGLWFAFLGAAGID